MDKKFVVASADAVIQRCRPTLLRTFKGTLAMVYNRRQSGYTLIEILVVIAVLSLLAALIFPMFGRVRGAARQIHCTSNLRQLGQALAMYRSDYDDRYPFAADPAIHLTGGNFMLFPDMDVIGPALPMLSDVMSPYVRSREVWHCPSDAGNVVIDVPHVPYPSMYEKFGMSYFYYIAPAYSQTVGFPPGAKSVTSSRARASVPMMWDGGWYWHGASDWPGRANVLFSDGHVKSQTLIQHGAHYGPPSGSAGS